ncbi:tetratricopeptide repeat protein [Cesiribacter andamanensis]|uniref:Tetratricopeptide repeat protein n=1 Tax=Cesiribacter andamanensis AMV16 TaxID=1279009 RepID=M7N6N6_9BACT|nr:tetratricopeptide repeat protein [Cesiribacter andamanensis]EMR02891.1 tetratricopeptide repeat protein [Cesiribacter andamanensis AMV16]
MRLPLVFAFVLLLCAGSLQAQHPALRPQGPSQFEKGLELMEKQQWAAARRAFSRFLETEQPEANDLRRAEAAYYIAYSAINLSNDDAEALTENFLLEYPYHPKAQLAYYELARFYYSNKNYNRAATYYERVNPAALTPAQRDEVDFNLAYTYFSNKDFDKALERFNKLKRSNNRYSYAASYYAGYIYFTKGEYDQAAYDLQRAEQNEAFAAQVPPLMANIYYRQGLYDKLISYAEQKGGSRKTSGSELELLTAEAYFKKEEYAKAATYFKQYAGSKKLDGPLAYRLGFSQYKSGQPKEAIENFKGVANQQDSLGQYAAYYLGQLYLDQNNDPFAQTAFQRASSLNFDPKIKEESLFKLAKLQFKQQNYDAAALALRQFIEQYPKTGYRQEATELLSEALLKNQNYEQAIAYIEQLENKNPRIRKAYQEVTFLHGAELFNTGKFFNAVQNFEKSLKFPEDQETTVKANFWSAEAYSIGQKWDESKNFYAAVFRQASPDSDLHLRSRYGIGYAYYNSKQYDRSQVHFKEFVDRAGAKNPFYHDALLRLGDSYYATKNYNAALDAYQRAQKENTPEKDYALFQTGLVNGLLDKNAEAMQAWNTLTRDFPNSQYVDDAQFNKAELQFSQGRYTEALQLFNQFVQQHANSPFVPYAYRSIGLSHYNLKNYEAAANAYIRILENYPSHTIANGVLMGLQEVLNLQGRPEEFNRYLALYRKANPADQALETVEFESAKNMYFSQKYPQAIEQLQAYLKTYPSSSNAPEARFYLAEAFYRSNRTQEALAQYQTLAKSGPANLQTRSLERLAEISYRSGDYLTATRNYRRLERLAGNRRQQIDAWAGLMDTYYRRQQYDSTMYYANQLTNQSGAAANLMSKALLLKGKVALARKNYSEATTFLRQTVDLAKDENAAEAYYLIAYVQHLQEQYKESVETLFGYNAQFSAFKFWLGKSFILIAENYLKMGEIFQAKETLRSIIENATEPAIVEEAKKRLNEIQQQEATQQQQQAPANSQLDQN